MLIIVLLSTPFIHIKIFLEVSFIRCILQVLKASNSLDGFLVSGKSLEKAQNGKAVLGFSCLVSYLIFSPKILL